MEAHTQKLIQEYKCHGKRFTLHQAFEELGLQESYCSKLIQPINAVAIGQYSNGNSSKRNAVIVVFDLKLRGM